MTHINGGNLICVLSGILAIYELFNIVFIAITGYDCNLHLDNYDSNSGYCHYKGLRGESEIDAYICSISHKPEIVRRVDKLGRCYTANQITLKVLICFGSAVIFSALMVLWFLQ